MRPPGNPNRHAREEDDDADDDAKPRPRKSSSGDSDVGAAAGAAAGTSVGMILLIVGGLATCCLCLPAIGVALLLPAIQKVRAAAERVHAVNNMKQIGFGCHNFEGMNRFLPSPRMQPQFANPQAPDLSWRVSVLPFVEQDALFRRFDKSQAWDGPNNQVLQGSMPLIFVRDKDAKPGQTQTTYQYFTGPNTLFPTPLTKQSLGNIPDGSSNTFLFAEAANPVPWSKQADMEVQPGPLSIKAGIFMAVMADGAVRTIDRSRVSDDGLRVAIDPRDNRPIPAGVLD